MCACLLTASSVWYAADDLLTSEPRPMIDDENFLAVNDFFNHITGDINKAGGK